MSTTWPIIRAPWLMFQKGSRTSFQSISSQSSSALSEGRGVDCLASAAVAICSAVKGGFADSLLDACALVVIVWPLGFGVGCLLVAPNSLPFGATRLWIMGRPRLNRGWPIVLESS